jgi:hypothetical protein
LWGHLFAGDWHSFQSASERRRQLLFFYTRRKDCSWATASLKGLKDTPPVTARSLSVKHVGKLYTRQLPSKSIVTTWQHDDSFERAVFIGWLPRQENLQLFRCRPGYPPCRLHMFGEKNQFPKQQTITISYH